MSPVHQSRLKRKQIHKAKSQGRWAGRAGVRGESSTRVAVQKGEGAKRKEEHKGKAPGQAYSNSLEGRDSVKNTVFTTYKMLIKSAIILAEAQQRQEG